MPTLDTAAAVKHLRKADPVMRDLIKSVGACGLKPGARGDHFTTLLRAIIGQQLSAKAAETIWLRLVALHPNGRKIRPEDVLAMQDKLMRSAGLSNAKVAYAKDLAQHVVDGRLKLASLGRKPDEEIVAELVAVNGIGVWTAEMFMMFRLGRPDVWAIGDLGLRNAVKNLYGPFPGGEPTKANLIDTAEPWRPWRSVASWYLWRSLSLSSPSLGRKTAVPV